MKMKTTYLLILLFSLSFFSCSNEEIISPDDAGKPIEIPVSIKIASGENSQVQAKAESDAEGAIGTSDVNEILLIVYSGPTATTNIKQLTYHSHQTLTCTENGRFKIAHGSISVTTDTNYAVFALGYNNESDIHNFAIEPVLDQLIAGVTTYGDTKVSLKKISEAPDSYKTPELFAGNVMPEGVTKFVFTAQKNEEIALTGTLYRAVGKCLITLTDIPANIKKISWLTEKMPAWNHLYNETYANLSPKYPMGGPTSDEHIQMVSEVASVEHADNVVWNTTLESFFIPLDKSHFYIDVTDDKDTKTRYLVKCANKMYNTIWVALVGYGVQDYYFYIKPNYQLSISGSFEQLKFSGNIKIDLSAMEEYDGGLLE